MVKIAWKPAALLIAAVALSRPAAAQSDSSSGGAADERAPDIPVVTIKEAVDFALSAGEERKIADGNLAAAKAGYELALSKKGVSLSGSGSYSMTDNFGGDLSGPAASSLSRLIGSEGVSHSIQGGLTLSAGSASRLSLSATESIPIPPSPASTSLGVSLAQTIWDGYPGGQIRATVEKAAISYKKNELDAAQSRSSVATAVKKAFVGMLTAQRTVDLMRSSYEKASASLRMIEATYALQQASTIDLMSAQVSARKAELDLSDAALSLDTTRRGLASLMGRDPDSAFAVAELEEPELPASSVDEAVAVGLEKRSEVARNGLSRRSSAIDLALARAAAQPTVSGSAALKMGIVGGEKPGDAYQASLGVSIAMPILDSGAAEAQAAAATAQLSILDAQAKQQLRSIENDIRDKYWAASASRDRIGATADARDLADKRVELARIQLQFGTVTNQDLLDMQAAAAKAASDYLAAKGAYFLKEIDLETAMGL